MSCLAVLVLGEFSRLADSFVFTMWIFYGMGAVALFILRKKMKEVERPYRVPWYPVVPLVFIAASVLMTVLSVLDDPKVTLIWVGVLLAGVPVYFVWKKMFPGNALAENAGAR